MKNIALFIIIGITLVGCATLTPSLANEESLTTIEEFPDLTTTEIYDRAELWVVRAYNSANDVIQMQDPEAGRIIGRGMGSTTDLGFQRYFSYTLIIEVRENRVRVRYENISSERVGDTAGPDMNFQWHKVEESLRAHTNDLLTFIETAGAEEDW